MTIGIDAEVLRNELASVAEEMALMVQRTARSTAARESGDYSTALMASDGSLLAQGMAHGIHLGSMAGIMPHVMQKYAERGFRPGDIVMSNDPYAGLSHLPDIVLVAPVFHDSVVAGFVAVEMHHSDIGGRFAGGMSAASESLYEEGLLLPTVLLHDAGVPNTALLEVIRRNVRRSEIVLGDLNAEISAVRHGLQHFQRIVAKYGLDRLATLTEQLFDFDRQAIARLVAGMEIGVHAASDRFEGDGSADSGSYRLQASLTVAEGSLTFDFSGTDPQAPSAINCPLGLTRSAVLSVVRGFVGEGVNVTGGLFEKIAVHSPEGALTSPRFPAAVGARAGVLWRVVDLVTSLMSQAGAEPMLVNGDGGVSALVFAPAGGEWPVLLDLYAGGWGARSDADGIDGTSSLISGGMLRSMSAEVMELEYPVVLESFEFVPDTEGEGKYRGSLSVAREWVFEAAGVCELRVCRRDSVATGAEGGGPGGATEVVWWRGEESLAVPGGLQPVMRVRSGDRVRHVQSGGGGFGNAAERDRETIRTDVLEGKLSPERAAKVYEYDDPDAAPPS